jgi:hypothetical protein
MRLLLAACLSLFLIGCGSGDSSPATSPSEDTLTSEAIIRQAVAAHGGPVIDTSVVTFTFRGARFRLLHDHGRFQYERITTDSLGQTVREVLANDSLYREVNGQRVPLTEEQRASLNTTVNSVSYFALLPHALTDPAVQSRTLGIDTVRGVPYHQVEVTFAQDGGGPDWEDRFVYWFRTDTMAMDFLAYAYGLGEGDDDPGHRFREAYNIRTHQGVRIADYVNYTDSTITPATLEQYPDRFGSETLNEVSRIEVDSVSVLSLPTQ